MTGIDDELRRVVLAWREDDPDEATQREIDELIAKGAFDDLRDRFSGLLQFGTAGLRGVIGAGPNRMNRAVVARATAGLVAYVLAHVEDAKERGICIGYDGRRLSKELAEDTAAIVAAAGVKARIFEQLVATPILAFAVLDQKAAAGVMVTASHNPPEYNGYKVYWENGAQIIPPQDEGIAKAIDAIAGVRGIPRLEKDAALQKGLRVVLGDATLDRYFAGVAKHALHPEAPRAIKIAYTALHGVGDRFAHRALKEAGFADVTSVPEQAEPDARFPTVAFPNPEEPGAMDLVMALARKSNADLVIANDPDADRLAVAVRGSDGAFEVLNGNDIGCLLAHYALSETKRDPARLVISTVVSSPMLGAIAAAHGARFEQTLTGFKWIANRAIERERQGAKFVLGYEEALGYCAGSLVRDKDGIGAALLMADMAAFTKHQGRTLLDERERAYRQYGLFLSRQISVTLLGLEGKQRIGAIMRGVRAAPPTQLSGIAVDVVVDYEAATRTVRGKPPEALGTHPANVIALELSGGHRVMLRPSGTEPKIKYYVDVRAEVVKGEPIETSRSRGTRLLDEISAALRAHVDGI